MQSQYQYDIEKNARRRIPKTIDNIHMYILEWVDGFSLLDSCHNVVIDTEAGGHREHRKRDVRDNADDGEQCEGHEHNHAGAKYDARGLRITPQKNILHCNIRRVS